jgi:hypothetical protein
VIPWDPYTSINHVVSCRNNAAVINVTRSDYRMYICGAGLIDEGKFDIPFLDTELRFINVSSTDNIISVKTDTVENIIKLKKILDPAFIDIPIETV